MLLSLPVAARRHGRAYCCEASTFASQSMPSPSPCIIVIVDAIAACIIVIIVIVAVNSVTILITSPLTALVACIVHWRSWVQLRQGGTWRACCGGA